MQGTPYRGVVLVEDEQDLCSLLRGAHTDGREGARVLGDVLEVLLGQVLAIADNVVDSLTDLEDLTAGNGFAGGAKLDAPALLLGCIDCRGRGGGEGARRGGGLFLLGDGDQLFLFALVEREQER